MKKNHPKGLFLIVIVVAAALTRLLYPTITIPPSDASVNMTSFSTTASSPSASTSSQASALDSADSAAGTAGGGAANSTTPYFGEANIAGSVFTRVATTQMPVFSQHASLVDDLTNGVALAQVNQDARWPTASITKLMTATVVFDDVSPDARITITPHMMAVYPQEETLVVNGTYTVDDLLHVLLMPSSNVAAEAFAEFYGRAAFMAVMNQRAEQWGMTNTYFDDPSGLSSANQSTAHDLAILAQHVYENYPQILAITRTPETTVTDLATGKKYDVKSINSFAGQTDFLGGKTGYTDQADDNLLSIFVHDGHPALIIVLGVADRFADTTKLLNWFTMNYQ